jgi:hypothetical protein
MAHHTCFIIQRVTNLRVSSKGWPQFWRNKGILVSGTFMLSVQSSSASQVPLTAVVSIFFSMSLTLSMWSHYWRLSVKPMDSKSYSFQNFIVNSVLLNSAGAVRSEPTECIRHQQKRLIWNRMLWSHSIQSLSCPCESKHQKILRFNGYCLSYFQILNVISMVYGCIQEGS